MSRKSVSTRMTFGFCDVSLAMTRFTYAQLNHREQKSHGEIDQVTGQKDLHRHLSTAYAVPLKCALTTKERCIPRRQVASTNDDAEQSKAIAKIGLRESGPLPKAR
jgi:hypothetical protein